MDDANVIQDIREMYREMRERRRAVRRRQSTILVVMGLVVTAIAVTLLVRSF